MKIGLISRYELLTLLRRPAFLILAFGLPLLGVAVLAVTNLTGSNASDTEQPASSSEEIETEGYVDMAGLIEGLPPDLPADALVPFASESEAERALEAGDIAAYYVVPADYISTGQLQYIHPTVNPLGGQGQDWVIRRALVYNLVGGDQSLLDQIWTPIDTQAVDLAAAEQQASGDCDRPNANCESSELVRLIPTLLVIFMFVLLTNAAGLMMRNVSLEKQNRMMEILTSSASPVQIMTGKIAGLGVGSLLAFGMWLLSAWLAMRLANPSFLPAGFSVPGELLPWMVAFFLLGFALFGTLSAGIGALVPSLKESTQAAWLIMAPLLIGYMAALFNLEHPHNALMTVLSLIPLSSPMVMVVRLSAGGVAAWQLVLSVAILCATVAVAIWVGARLFRAQNLLSGEHFSIRRVLQALAA